MRLTMRCPRCGHVSDVEVPRTQCVLVHDCPGCGAELRRKPGSCCVYCSHPDDTRQAAPAGC